MVKKIDGGRALALETFKTATIARLAWAGRLFRTTAFKLALAYVIIIGLGFTLALGRLGENVGELIDQQIDQTLDADVKGLTDQFDEAGSTSW